MSERLDLGDVEVTAVLGGHLRLDGGAMFGVVPRPLWERVRPADERHRVDNACRCLLVRTGDAVVLVDTGCGQRFDARARDIYAVDPAVDLVAHLAAAGVMPDQVTHVLANRSIMRVSHPVADLLRLADRVPLRFLAGDGEVVRGILARRAAAADWIVAWDHDPEAAFSRVRDDGRGGWRAAPVHGVPGDAAPADATALEPGS